MSNKQIAVKPSRIHHQSPTHVPSRSRDRFDIVLIHRIKAGPSRTEGQRPEALGLDGSMDLGLEELEILGTQGQRDRSEPVTQR